MIGCDESQPELVRKLFDRALYPLCRRFPGAPRPALERRAQTVLALYGAHPVVEPQVVVSICLLAELTQRGPWAPVFHRPQYPDRRVDWLGAPT